MDSDNPKNQDEHAGSSTPDNHDVLRRDLAALSLSQKDSRTKNSETRDTNRSGKEEEEEHTEPGASKPGERPRIYRINTLNEDGDSVGEEDEDEEGSNISPDQLFDIVFNLDTPREVDLKVSIKGDFNVTILA
ncbi:hypothetical protein BJX66DRAFT_261046 [Aspergillus keveii]|uniref:Uncharacterized protein n=1 Tax=Aspergillus keveii TaxID=714993 RepID=A0ABR4FZD9_9EURO